MSGREALNTSSHKTEAQGVLWKQPDSGWFASGCAGVDVSRRKIEAWGALWKLPDSGDGASGPGAVVRSVIT